MVFCERVPSTQSQLPARGTRYCSGQGLRVLPWRICLASRPIASNSTWSFSMADPASILLKSIQVYLSSPRSTRCWLPCFEQANLAYSGARLQLLSWWIRHQGANKCSQDWRFAIHRSRWVRGMLGQILVGLPIAIVPFVDWGFGQRWVLYRYTLGCLFLVSVRPRLSHLPRLRPTIRTMTLFWLCASPPK